MYCTVIEFDWELIDDVFVYVQVRTIIWLSILFWFISKEAQAILGKPLVGC